jgi:transposase
MEKHDGRNKSKEAQKEIRLLAINHWKKTGNMLEVARTFGVSYPAVRKWVKKYQCSGMKVLHSDDRGRPEGKELTPRQEQKVIGKITNKHPEQLKLSFGLWTRENVGELIYKEFGIRRSARQIGRYLNAWGFTPQKPVYKAYEQKSAEVQKWLEVIYPKIRKVAKSIKATIYWGDETGIRSHDNRGRSFAPKGQTPIVLKTGKQFGVNMISAISNRGKLLFMIYRGAINSEKFIRFIKRLSKSRKGMVFLIVDNLSAHKTIKVKNWIKENEGKIKLFYLPVYSPELNPDEYLNQDLKANIVGKVRMNAQDDLKKGVVNFLNRRKRNPKQIKKYFHHKKVKYAA